MATDLHRSDVKKDKLLRAPAAQAAGVGGGVFSGGARPTARLVAAVGNSAMVLYVYLAHLWSVEWHRFGTFGLRPDGQHAGLRDYLMRLDVDAAFNYLRTFTFSEAMFHNPTIYVVVGTPVSLVLLALERDRMRWLSTLVADTLPAEEAARAIRWFRTYLVSMAIMLAFILLLAPVHIGFPIMHYVVAGVAIASGSFSMVLSLNFPIDLDAVAAARGDDPEVARWIHRVRHVERPVVKLCLGLHLLAVGVAVWKSECLGDDRLSLLFGVVETLLILGYQLFAGIFVLDDLELSRKAKSLGDDRLSLLFGMVETFLTLGYQLFDGIFVLDDLELSRKAPDAAPATAPAPAPEPAAAAPGSDPPTPGSLENSTRAEGRERLLES